MQTIETKHYPATDYSGKRIKAQSSNGHKIWLSWDYGLNEDENHIKAAKALKEKLGWNAKMVGGDSKNGLIFVFVDDYYRI